jgi:hypothetical protein
MSYPNATPRAERRLFVLIRPSRSSEPGEVSTSRNLARTDFSSVCSPAAARFYSGGREPLILPSTPLTPAPNG